MSANQLSRTSPYYFVAFDREGRERGDDPGGLDGCMSARIARDLLYWLVMPQAFPDRLPFSSVDAALFLGMGGLFAAAALGRMSSRALVPTKDPRLAESIRFENI